MSSLPPEFPCPGPALAPDSVTLRCIVTTVAREADAQRLAAAVLAQRLAACVQIEALQSHYRWRGELQAEAEWRLSCKTLPEHGPALLETLRRLHPYELPELCWTDWQASADYGRWVAENVGASAAPAA